jgi:hypothetical protein
MLSLGSLFSLKFFSFVVVLQFTTDAAEVICADTESDISIKMFFTSIRKQDKALVSNE